MMMVRDVIDYKGEYRKTIKTYHIDDSRLSEIIDCVFKATRRDLSSFCINKDGIVIKGKFLKMIDNKPSVFYGEIGMIVEGSSIGRNTGELYLQLIEYPRYKNARKEPDLLNLLQEYIVQ